MDYLGSLSERITSTTICIIYNRCTRQKYFHRGNHKGENPANFLRIVRWSKAVIRSIQQLSISPPLSLSLSLMRTWECEVCINEGEHLPIYTILSHLPNKIFEPTCHLTWVPLLLKRPQLHITWCYTGDYCLDLQRRLYLKV